jgi:hypothetical protein
MVGHQSPRAGFGRCKLQAARTQVLSNSCFEAGNGIAHIPIINPAQFRESTSFKRHTFNANDANQRIIQIKPNNICVTTYPVEYSPISGIRVKSFFRGWDEKWYIINILGRYSYFDVARLITDTFVFLL